jgi:hypothetical protein
MTTTKLSDRALLVQLNISQWVGRKFDRSVSEKVAIDYRTDVSVGRYNKALLPATDALKRIQAKTTSIRADFYKNTSPWGIEGTNILSTKNYLGFMAQFRKHSSEWWQLVDSFVSAYPQLVSQAQASLGPMFNVSDYPPAEAIRDKFYIDLAVFPVPATDFRVQLGDDIVAGIRQDIEERVQHASRIAMQDLWSKLHDKVQKVQEKLVDPAAIFRDSLIENVQEQCDLLKRMNFNDDPDLEAMRVRVEQAIAACHPDNLRLDPDYRQEVADEAAKIMAEMQGYF